jgi:polar amino acid transport system permease protein
MQNLHFQTAFEELFPQLLDALWVVITLAVLAFALALVIGLLIALGRLSKLKLLGRILLIFVEIVRGTPLLVQLLYVYYVLPEIVSRIVGTWNPGFHWNLNAMTAGIIALGINYGCYLSEVFRASILAIDPGQMKAAQALGYTPRMAMWRIVIPQSLRISVPTLGNYFIMMSKDTSLCAFITVGEIILTTSSYASQTFLTIESYTLAAIIYLVLSLPLARLVLVLERRLSRHV